MPRSTREEEDEEDRSSDCSSETLTSSVPEVMGNPGDREAKPSIVFCSSHSLSSPSLKWRSPVSGTGPALSVLSQSQLLFIAAMFLVYNLTILSFLPHLVLFSALGREGIFQVNFGNCW